MYEEPYWISGLAVPKIIDGLQGCDLFCEGPAPRGETMSAWECKGSAEEHEASYEVSIVGRDAEHVRTVTAKAGRR